GRRRRRNAAGQAAPRGPADHRGSGEGATQKVAADRCGADDAAHHAAAARGAGDARRGRLAAGNRGAAHAARAVAVLRPGAPDRDRLPARARPGFRQTVTQASTTGLVNVPMPSTVTETSWPACIGPTPSGVPVRMTSPGSSVMI